jgi:hypothetical protein
MTSPAFPDRRPDIVVDINYRRTMNARVLDKLAALDTILRTYESELVRPVHGWVIIVLDEPTTKARALVEASAASYAGRMSVSVVSPDEIPSLQLPT